MPKTSKISIELTKDRDTKGTYVYKNNDQGAAVPSLYIKKSAFEGEAPASIKLTIEEN